MSDKVNNYINHVLFVLDKSGSMKPLEDDVIRVFDAQVAHLAKRSQELDQETRVTVYLFDTSIECIIYDKDVLRLPSLRQLYHAGGNTALIDATVQAVTELRETPERYGDHAFLGYVVTDGEENASHKHPDVLMGVIEGLPENWTLATLVPNQTGVYEAKRFGFPADNICVWDTTGRKGIEEAIRRIRDTTETFMIGRTHGLRGTRNLFTLNTANLTKAKVARNLQQLSANQYKLLQVRREAQIRNFVENSMNLGYTKGCAFYQMVKPETIQSYKEICVRDRTTGQVFGGWNARNLLGLPDAEAKVQPGDYSNFDVFVQSTSVNRKLVPGTSVLVMLA